MNTETLIELGRQARIEKAKTRAEKVRWFVEPLARQGWPLSAITRELNERRIMTPSGRGRWSKSMTRRALVRLDLCGGQTP